MTNASSHEKVVVGTWTEGNHQMRLVEFDHLQWAVESFYGGRWRPKLYFHTRAAGLEFYHIPKEITEALPEYFPERKED
jgi:hypothetical protein